MEAPIPNNEKKIDTPEQECPVPPGYDSIPHEWWLFGPGADRLDEELNWKAYIEAPTFRDFRDRTGKASVDFFIRPFRAMRRGISNILLNSDMASKIEKGEYALILGEDSSARIHTLFLKEVLDYMSDAHNIPRPATNFYAGLRAGGHIYEDWFLSRDSMQERAEREQKERMMWKENIAGYIEEIKKTYLSGANQGKRILICTETISRGGSLRNITEILEEHGCSFDVISFASDNTILKKPAIKKIAQNHEIFLGGEDYGTEFEDTTQTNYWLSGVFKKQGDIHARSAKSEPDVLLDEINVDEDHKYKYKNARKLSQRDIENMDAMRVVRGMAKYVGANVAQAYLDYKAGKFELPTEPK